MIARSERITQPVPHCPGESQDTKNYKIMTQKNEMSARALTMEELENVNGGVRITTGGGRCIRRPKNK